MEEVIVVSEGVFNNRDPFYESKALMNNVLEEITDKLYNRGVHKGFLRKPTLTEVDIPISKQIMYSVRWQEIEVPKSYFSEVEQMIKDDKKSASDKIEFVLGEFYGRHIFNVFTGFQGMNKSNQHHYREFADIFSNWFRDTMYPFNQHVCKIANEGFSDIENRTRDKLTQKLTQEGYFELFQNLANYFLKTYLKDAKSIKKPQLRKL